MTNLIFWSCAVSALTLAVLLWRRHNPTFRYIPSAFLGALKSTAPLKVRLSTPPPIGWILVLLFTAGAALTYYPPPNLFFKTGENEVGLLWVDNTLSAHLSFSAESANIQKTLTSLNALNLKLYGLKENFSIDTSGKKLTYEIISLDSNQKLEQFIRTKTAEPPLPFLRPLSAPDLALTLATVPDLAQAKGTFVALSDGQRETLQMTSTLKPLFAKARSVFLPLAPDLEGKKHEIVPTEIYKLWQEDNKQDPSRITAFSLFNSLDSQIPAQARPALFREEFLFEKSDISFFIPAEEQNKNTIDLSMITGCALQLPGPLEFDSFADLRSFAQFFSVPLRLQACAEKSSENSNIENNDPWKYRRQTIWAVQTDEEVLNSLTNRSEPWLPQHFVESADSVVYVASHRLRFTPGLFQQIPVQLDPDLVPTPIYLMPEPLPQMGYEPIFTAADGTPLGYKNKNYPGIFYLRTPTAMPNGELGRSSRWTNFWFEVARSKGKSSPSVQRTVYSDVQNYLKDTPSKPQIKKEKLNLISLNWEPQNSAIPAAGIFNIQEQGSPNTSLHLIAFPPQERSRAVISPEEFETGWRLQTSASEKSNSLTEQNPGKGLNNKRAVAGSILGIFACFFLWFVGPRMGWSIFLCGFIYSFLVSKTVLAQSIFSPRRNPMQGSRSHGPATLPFRVAWCDAEVGPEVAARYTTLRNMLASRGTIEMPAQLIPGGCHPGASEIWWTDNTQGIDPKLLSEHLSSGGIFVVEGQKESEIPAGFLQVADISVGMSWQAPKKRGLLYRSFYLLPTFDGCMDDRTKLLSIQKKPNAHSPLGIITSARFLSLGTSGASDCFVTDDDYRSRSFVNLMYSFLTTDYKEDQLQLPEILNRVRNLGLEP